VVWVVFVLLLFFNVFGVKVGRGKVWRRVESMYLEWGSWRRTVLFSLWFATSLCHAGSSSQGFTSTRVETLGSRERQ